MSLNEFEMQRQRKIDDNKRRMSELGIGALAAKVTAPTHAPVSAPPVRCPQSALFVSDFPPGLTLAHFSAQLGRLVWDWGCAQGLCSPC